MVNTATPPTKEELEAGIKVAEATAENICPEKCHSFQGHDTLQCSLPIGHEGDHKVGGWLGDYFSSEEECHCKELNG